MYSVAYILQCNLEKWFKVTLTEFLFLYLHTQRLCLIFHSFQLFALTTSNLLSFFFISKCIKRRKKNFIRAFVYFLGLIPHWIPGDYENTHGISNGVLKNIVLFFNILVICTSIFFSNIIITWLGLVLEFSSHLLYLHFKW